MLALKLTDEQCLEHQFSKVLDQDLHRHLAAGQSAVLHDQEVSTDVLGSLLQLFIKKQGISH